LLALVSYPSYDPESFEETYQALRDDTLRTPLRFRAVANQYAPGSIVKPLASLAGLSSGMITLETQFTCSGYLYPNVRTRFRCWQVGGSGPRKVHGTINVVEAIEGSCNIFFYNVGEEVGIDYLTDFFDMFGFGRSTGIGLKEETKGINPTPNWMGRRGRRITPGMPRHLAIGQGELTATPVQVANVFAQYASGIQMPVTLIRGLRDEIPEWQLPGEPEHWTAVREGLFRVVNSVDGTANYYAYYDGDGYRICGKTGSATTPRRPLSYRVPYTDAEGHAAEAIVPAGSKSQAVDDFRRRYPRATFVMDEVVKHEAWPPDEDRRYAHAWFGGFLQPVDVDGEPLWHIRPRIAFVILVEFGSSGGRAAGPFAKQMVPLLMDTLGPALTPDGHPVPEPEPAAEEVDA
jgi:cell division protein FtsI/penicillin-binding protein 2